MRHAFLMVGLGDQPAEERGVGQRHPQRVDVDIGLARRGERHLAQCSGRVPVRLGPQLQIGRQSTDKQNGRRSAHAPQTHTGDQPHNIAAHPPGHDGAGAGAGHSTSGPTQMWRGQRTLDFVGVAAPLAASDWALAAAAVTAVLMTSTTMWALSRTSGGTPEAFLWP